MHPRERTVTWVLIAACCLSAGLSVAPRLLERRHPLSVERPDLRVSIEGAVARPGVYALPWGARVTDLVDAAGGYGAGAARALVSLADPLTDGEVVQVPAVATASGTPRVRLNEATAQELMGLPGIGPALAQRIVSSRPFASVDELLEVQGIGPKTLERLRPSLGL